MEEMWKYWGGESARLYRKGFSRVGWALTAMLCLQLGVQLLVFALAEALHPAWLESQLFWFVTTLVASYGVAFPTAILILRGFRPQDSHPQKKLTGREGLEIWFMGLGWMYIANLITLSAMSALEAMRGKPISNPLAEMAGQPVLYNLLLGCILAPVAEELLFRRAIIDHLRPWGEGFAVVASALLFSLSHANLFQMLYAFTVGVILGGVYLRTGQVRYTMLLHAGLNLVSLALMPAVELLGKWGDWFLSAMVLAAIIWAFRWTFRRRAGFQGVFQELRWGNGEIWGHFFVNSGMTAFVLAVIGAVFFTALSG